MKRIIAVLGVVVVAGGVAVALASRDRGARAPSYRTVAVEQGDIAVTVSSTGTLSADTTVTVAAQVSGQITRLFADFNSRVKKGELIARIDPGPSELEVRTAEAAVQHDVADSMLKAFTLTQATSLHNTGMMTDNDFVSARTAFEVSNASLRAARVGLARARQDLAYTYIYAPIDGVVVERDVQVGQTVAAGFAAPQLFVIASDLRRMQILVWVDEADIGTIRVGQKVQFTVTAYPSRTLAGTVRQVRIQSAVSQNVVDYTVVVAVSNLDGALLPGMTATVAFEVARAADVLKVANAALQFEAPGSLLAQYRMAHPGRPVPATAAGGGTGARLWYLDATGQPAVLVVRTGLTDGQSTAIEGAGIGPGLRAIAGVESRAGATGVASPFQSEQQQMGPPPGPPPPGPPPPGPGGG